MSGVFHDGRTEGRRIYPGEDGRLRLAPGDYGFEVINGTAQWVARPPNTKIHAGSLADHEVTEHVDGTITVSPSILIEQSNITWHGYLERGIWRRV